MSNKGKTCIVDYVGTFDNGEKFDSSIDRGEPISFVCDAGMMISGFDAAVAEMEVGETKKIHLEPAEAYGEWSEMNVMTVPTDIIPNAAELPIGRMIYMDTENGPVPMTCTKIENGMATFDLNHPMAGKALNFEITLIEVKDAVEWADDSCGCGCDC